MPRIRMRGGDERDILGTKKGRRHYFCRHWLRRNSNRIKTWYRRRERQVAKSDLREKVSVGNKG